MRKLAFLSVAFALVAVSFYGCEDKAPTEPVTVSEQTGTSPFGEKLSSVFEGGPQSEHEGLTIKIRAGNRSTTDAPFCGIGSGLEGDRLDVDVFTDLAGVTTGRATLTPANGPVINLNIDQVLAYCCGGLALVDSSNGNTIAVWLDQGNAPVYVNVEIPRGCENSRSTFTAGADRLNAAIAIRG